MYQSKHAAPVSMGGLSGFAGEPEPPQALDIPAHQMSGMALGSTTPPADDAPPEEDTSVPTELSAPKMATLPPVASNKPLYEKMISDREFFLSEIARLFANVEEAPKPDLIALIEAWRHYENEAGWDKTSSASRELSVDLYVRMTGSPFPENMADTPKEYSLLALPTREAFLEQVGGDIEEAGSYAASALAEMAFDAKKSAEATALAMEYFDKLNRMDWVRPALMVGGAILGLWLISKAMD